MQIILGEEIFKKENNPLENFFYNNRNQLIQKDVVLAPWTHWLNTKSPILEQLKNDNTFFGKCATILQHCKYWEFEELFLKLGITTVVNPTPDLKKKTKLALIPCPYVTTLTLSPAQPKNIECSYIGAKTHSVRANMLSFAEEPNWYIVVRNQYHNYERDISKKVKKEKEYCDVMERSKFVLCPRGFAPGSVRFWETLAAGAVPILSADDWVLPDIGLENIIIRIPEAEFCKERVKKEIGKISETEWLRLSLQTRTMYINYTESGAINYVNNQLCKIT
jgi:hypothetical protein